MPPAKRVRTLLLGPAAELLCDELHSSGEYFDHRLSPAGKPQVRSGRLRLEKTGRRLAAKRTIANGVLQVGLAAALNGRPGHKKLQLAIFEEEMPACRKRQSGAQILAAQRDQGDFLRHLRTNFFHAAATASVPADTLPRPTLSPPHSTAVAWRRPRSHSRLSRRKS